MMLRPCAGLPELRIRPIRPDDKALLVAGHGQLSERSVYQRFLAPKPRLSAAELRYLTEVDGVDHVALVAVLAHAPQVLAGVGRWVRDPQTPDAAEIAIVVADDLQGRGVGRSLGAALAQEARRRGITRFTALMLPDNDAAQRLYADVSAQLHAARLPVAA